MGDDKIAYGKSVILPGATAEKIERLLGLEEGVMGDGRDNMMISGHSHEIYTVVSDTYLDAAECTPDIPDKATLMFSKFESDSNPNQPYYPRPRPYNNTYTRFFFERTNDRLNFVQEKRVVHHGDPYVIGDEVFRERKILASGVSSSIAQQVLNLAVGAQRCSGRFYDILKACDDTRSGSKTFTKNQ